MTETTAATLCTWPSGIHNYRDGACTRCGRCEFCDGGDIHTAGCAANTGTYRTTPAPAPIMVTVEELRAGDELSPMPTVAADIAADTRKIIGQARDNNMANRPGIRIVRRIFLRGRTVEITTAAFSVARAPRGTVVAVIRPTN